MSADPSNPDTEEELRSLIRRALNLREERKAITDDIRDLLKEARLSGFDSRKITEVCIWLERVDQHGREAMLQAEQLFDLYRDVAEGPAKPMKELFDQARDRALAEMFAGGGQAEEKDEKPKLGKRLQAANDAAALARAAKIARGE